MAVLHPTMTMDDVTIVSSKKTVAEVNTIAVTKSQEIKPRTMLNIIISLGVGVAGILLLLMFHLPTTVVLLSTVITVPVSLFLLEGRTRDDSQDRQLIRLINRGKSKDIEGGVFYANSNQPEDILHAHITVFDVK